MKHCMLDLETWGLAPGSALRSIGAVMFDPFTKEIGERFYRNITKNSCIAAGLTVNPKTEKWWEEQSAEARTALEDKQDSLGLALDDFCGWWNKQDAEYIWAHGANFDPVLLGCALSACGYAAPWHYRAVRDTRTVYWLGGVNPSDLPKTGTHHNAMDDALNQVIALQLSFERIKLGFPSLPLFEAV